MAMRCWWGEALDNLLKAKGWTKTRLGDSDIISHRQLLRTYKGVYGPSVVVIQRILDGIDATWEDWAEACQHVAKPHYTPKKKLSKQPKTPVISRPKSA